MDITAKRDERGRREDSPRADRGDAPQATLADQLSSLARMLQSEDDTQRTLQAIVRAAVTTVPGAEHASVSAIERRREVRTCATTGELASSVDALQYETGEGPCLDSLFDHHTVRVDDMTSEARWRKFAAQAVQLGVGSMLAVQLYVRGDDLGALNLINVCADAFDDESEHIALLFAAHAAVAMAGALDKEQLHTALGTRDVIGQAKGMLMQRFKIDADQAFAVLVRASEAENRKLLDIATEITHKGGLP